jgi:hypothetical protein
VEGQYDLCVHDVSESDSGTFACVDDAGSIAAQRSYAHLLVKGRTTSMLHESQTLGADENTIVTTPTPSWPPVLVLVLVPVLVVISPVILFVVVSVLYLQRQRIRQIKVRSGAEKKEIIQASTVMPNDKKTLKHISNDIETAPSNGDSRNVVCLPQSVAEPETGLSTSRLLQSQVSSDSGSSSELNDCLVCARC